MGVSGRSNKKGNSVELIQQLGTTLGLGLLSGIRLYLTVLAVGVAVRFNWIHLNESFQGLGILADWRVMTAAGIACAIEFVADKVPWVDSAWDSLHTFIRPVGAVMLGVAAFGNLDPVLKTILALLCGGVALTGHSAKSATRFVANHSPEPVSNMGLSLAGDLMVPVATWFSFEYPLVTLGVVSVVVLISAWLSPLIFRIFRVELNAIGAAAGRFFRGKEEPPRVTSIDGLPAEFTEHLRALPDPYLAAVRDAVGEPVSGMGVRASARSSVPGMRHSIGYLCVVPGKLVFVTRRWFRMKTYVMPMNRIKNATWTGWVLMDDFQFEEDGKKRAFEIFQPAGVEALGGSAAANN